MNTREGQSPLSRSPRSMPTNKPSSLTATIAAGLILVRSRSEQFNLSASSWTSRDTIFKFIGRQIRLITPLRAWLLMGAMNKRWVQ